MNFITFMKISIALLFDIFLLVIINWKYNRKNSKIDLNVNSTTVQIPIYYQLFTPSNLELIQKNHLLMYCLCERLLKSELKYLPLENSTLYMLLDSLKQDSHKIVQYDIEKNLSSKLDQFLYSINITYNISKKINCSYIFIKGKLQGDFKEIKIFFYRGKLVVHNQNDKEFHLYYVLDLEFGDPISEEKHSSFCIEKQFSFFSSDATSEFEIYVFLGNVSLFGLYRIDLISNSKMFIDSIQFLKFY